MLEINNLRKSYGGTLALAGIDLTVRPGEIYGFVGANGAGKSTAMRIAMGVLAADAGTVRWRGERITFAVRRRFGYMPEERGLYPKMRIGEQIGYFAELHGLARADASLAARALLERMQVKAKSTDVLQDLSLGNQQRVQLAVALAHRPELLILDEPFSGLDPIGVDTMAEVLAEQCRAGVGIIFSSHQLELVERLCDRVGIIADGQMVAAGSIAELRARAGARVLEVEVEAPDSRWVEAVPGARVVGEPGGRTLIALDDPREDQAVLAAACAAGRINRFGWREQPLAELYRAVVEPSVAPPEPVGTAA